MDRVGLGSQAGELQLEVLRDRRDREVVHAALTGPVDPDRGPDLLGEIEVVGPTPSQLVERKIGAVDHVGQRVDCEAVGRGVGGRDVGQQVVREVVEGVDHLVVGGHVLLDEQLAHQALAVAHPDQRRERS